MSEDILKELIDNGELPADLSALEGALSPEQNGIYEVQESSYFDYKRSFPFSFTDDYFSGIVRLVVAFYNTFGGLIIFGVRDDTRDGGHNKVNINIERFNTYLRECFEESIVCTHRGWTDQAGRDIDVLLVPKRPGTIRLTYQTQGVDIYGRQASALHGHGIN